MKITINLASEGLDVVGLLLEFGVVGLLFLGVVGLPDMDPVRKSGNLYGETVRFSANCSSNANKNTHIKYLTSILEWHKYLVDHIIVEWIIRYQMIECVLLEVHLNCSHS